MPRVSTCAVAVLVLAACPSPAPPPAMPAPPPAVTDAAPPPPPDAAPAAAATGYQGLGATSIPPDVVARFAPPALAPEVSRRIQTMLDVRGAGGGVFTRKGDRMLFTWRVTGVSQVWRQDGPMRFPVQLTGGEDATSVVAIAPDDSFAVVSRDIGGSENPGLYLLDLDGGPLTEIQNLPDVQTMLAFITDDAKWVYYRSNDVAPDAYAIHRYNVATRQREAVWTEPGLWNVTDHAGDRLLMSKRLGADHIEVYTLDLATRALTPIIGQGEVEDYAAAFGTTPDTILLRTNRTGDFSRLYAWTAGAHRRRPDGSTGEAGGQLTPISPEQAHDVAGFGIDDARKRIYYTVNVDGYMKSFVLDGKTFKPVALPRLPAADNVRFAGTSRDGRFVELAIEGSTRAPETVSYDWKARRLTTWRVPSTPEVDVATFARATLESYPARDGTKIPMFVRRPSACPPPGTTTAGARPCPVVVDFHGGPEQQSTSSFSTTAQLYVDAGFVLVQPNVRGSSGYGKTWLHSDDGPLRRAVITDLEDCARYLRKEWAVGGVAPKIGVTGGSYGGYATLMAMTFFAGAYDAGVSVVGISSLTTYLANTAPYRRILRASEYGDPVADKDALVELSPLTYIDRLAAPLLVIQGLNDPRVPVGEALQIYRAAEARGVDRGLIVFPDEGHGAIKRQNQVLSIGNTIAFFTRHLK